MSERKHRLVDCDPRWISNSDGSKGCGIRFDCPEGHAGCIHVIPVTPALDGRPIASWQPNGCAWQRGSATRFETLTLSPSIRREPTYASREAAIAAGALPECLNDSHFCALHIFIRNGQIEFCGDSR